MGEVCHARQPSGATIPPSQRSQPVRGCVEQRAEDARPREFEFPPKLRLRPSLCVDALAKRFAHDVGPLASGA